MSTGSGSSPLRGLPKLRQARTRRFSSYDRTGGNDDRLHIDPGETVTIAEADGAGDRHAHLGDHRLRQPALPPQARPARLVGRRGAPERRRARSATSSASATAAPRNFVSLPLQMSPEDGKAFNCWFAMPFGSGARMEVTSEVDDADVLVYFYVDYEELDALDADIGRFHAQWRRPEPDRGRAPGPSNAAYQFGGTNLTGSDNYTILEAEGHGHYVGCVLNIQNRRRTRKWNWYGEGDDMIFIDGEREARVREPDPMARLMGGVGGQRVAADPARDRHRGLRQHRLVPDADLLRAVPRHPRGGGKNWTDR